RGRFVIFLGHGAFQIFLQSLHLRVELQRFRESRRNFADVRRAFVHRFQKRGESLLKRLVTMRAAEPAGLFKIGLAESAYGAFLRAAAFLDLLRSAKPEQQIGERETGWIGHALFL